MRLFRKRNFSRILLATLLVGTGIIVGLPKDLPRGPLLVSDAFAAEVEVQ